MEREDRGCRGMKGVENIMGNYVMGPNMKYLKI